MQFPPMIIPVELGIEAETIVDFIPLHCSRGPSTGLVLIDYVPTRMNLRVPNCERESRATSIRPWDSAHPAVRKFAAVHAGAPSIYVRGCG